MKYIPYQLTNLIFNLAILTLLLVTPAITMGQQSDKKWKTDVDSFMNNNKSSIHDSIKYYADLESIARIRNEIAKQNYYEIQYSKYFTDNLAHRKDSFNWQLYSSKLIFIMVIIIVLSGLIFAGLQFYQSTKRLNSIYKLANVENIDKIDKLAEGDSTNIDVSLSTGIKITSSIIGLLILTISIAFFYLYILYVYPINQINIDNINFTESKLPKKDPSSPTDD